MVSTRLKPATELVSIEGRMSGQMMHPQRVPFMRNLDQGEMIVSASPQLYIDIDVEADGKPGFGSLLAVGAIASRYRYNWDEEVDPNGPTEAGKTQYRNVKKYYWEHETFYRELKPASTLWIPSQREFCEEHGLERERLMDEGVNSSDAMQELAEWERQVRQKFNKERSVAVAFNASFDYPWVDLEMIRSGITNPFGPAGYCIKSLAQVLLPGYDWSKTSKSHLPSDVIPPGDFTHNALEDATYQQGMHFAMVGKIHKMMAPQSAAWLHGEDWS